ncbi:MAG TPA: polyprenyl synthetase family protein [Candidatus Limnocylindria bacterium]|nr:polyprenyl synthetase family protein [Candidatus Limnocylindria bacterium]
MDIRTEFTQILADIESEMSEILNERGGHARPLYEMLAYHLGIDGKEGRGGKRLRPLLGVLAYQSLGGDYRKALPGAAAVELGHNFSLVHDDIEDADRERRHRPTLWAVWGVPLAINAGDALFALSRLALYRLLDSEEHDDRQVIDLMRIYDETCLALCEGQYLDISFERRDDVTVDAYMEMIGKKTAALIGASVQAGAILASDDKAVHEAYRQFGYDLGMAFQIADDVKGSFWTSADSGKAEAGDIRKRKKTLPIVWALEHAVDADRQRLLEIYAHGVGGTDGRGQATPDEPVSDAEVAEVLAILERSGAREHALTEARRYRDLALDRVEQLPALAEGKRGLAALVRSMIAA